MRERENERESETKTETEAEAEMKTLKGGETARMRESTKGVSVAAVKV